MPDPLTTLGTAFLTGAGDALGHECVRRHGDDLQQLGDHMQQAAGKAWNESWQRDHDAGGISSWGDEEDTGLEPA